VVDGEAAEAGEGHGGFFVATFFDMEAWGFGEHEQAAGENDGPGELEGDL
jgi:hypothetical protein